MNIHQLDMVMASHPHIQYIEPPEANRPPFDQVPVEFHVQNNGDGFRDHEFNVDPVKQIVVLGDSVVLGKGVTQEERFCPIHKYSIWAYKDVQQNAWQNSGINIWSSYSPIC